MTGESRFQGEDGEVEKKGMIRLAPAGGGTSSSSFPSSSRGCADKVTRRVGSKNNHMMMVGAGIEEVMESGGHTEGLLVVHDGVGPSSSSSRSCSPAFLVYERGAAGGRE